VRQYTTLMADDHMFLAKIKGQEPEQFMFVTLAEDYSTIKHTGEPMSEKEVRKTLADAGMPEATIRARIEKARQHPI
jgi:hypothetical protein